MNGDRLRFAPRRTTAGERAHAAQAAAHFGHDTRSRSSSRSPRQRSRANLAHVQTVIVDEIRALAADKRGSEPARHDAARRRASCVFGEAASTLASGWCSARSRILRARPLERAHLGSGADFASALRPYLGNIGAALFALGMIEAGLVAIMTISTSSAYAIGDVSHRGASLNLDFAHARLFYITGLVSVALAAAIVLVPGAPLLAITLTVNVIATLLMPPALLFLLLLINDRSLVGDLANNRLQNVAVTSVIVLVAAVGAAYGLMSAFPGPATR